ncbi:MAG: hypothetical protein Q9223_007761 [Gallowayella weberi]
MQPTYTIADAANRRRISEFISACVNATHDPDTLKQAIWNGLHEELRQNIAPITESFLKFIDAIKAREHQFWIIGTKKLQVHQTKKTIETSPASSPIFLPNLAEFRLKREQFAEKSPAPPSAPQIASPLFIPASSPTPTPRSAPQISPPQFTPNLAPPIFETSPQTAQKTAPVSPHTSMATPAISTENLAQSTLNTPAISPAATIAEQQKKALNTRQKAFAEINQMQAAFRFHHPHEYLYASA